MMSVGRMGIAMSAALLCAVWAPAADGKDDPLLRPIAPDYAKRWLTPQPPIRIFGTSYLVGFGGLTVGLIQTSGGLILIDGAVPQAVPDIEANIRRLGFKLRDIKYILSTEPHYDHAGGIAALARDSGATVLASGFAAKELRAGQGDAGDPQASDLARFPGVARVRAVRDGEAIKLGNTVVTAVATPGHTLGSMSWTWRSCEGKRCATMVFAASVNPVSLGAFRFSAPSSRPFLDAYRGTFARLRAMPCDILITAHPQQSGGEEKYARLSKARHPNPYWDSKGCRDYADAHEVLLKAKLDKEAGR